MPMLYSATLAAKPVTPPHPESGAAASPESRPTPAAADPPLDIHLIAVGGTGMAPLACLLRGRGHRVRGSDRPLYPPMSTLLEAEGIRPAVGFDPRHLDPRPDLVVVGNAVPRDNPEALEVERVGIPRISMPEALARFFLAGRQPLVVAGTHGKTTTTAMAAWIYVDCDQDPGYLVGGVPRNLSRSFHEGSGSRFIVEGDEYNAAYFDRGPKFLHYRPETLVLTSVEYDHADLYPDPASLIEAYEQLVRLVPAEGLLVACGDAPEVRKVAAQAVGRVVFYGLGPDNDVRPAGPPSEGSEGCRFTISDPQAGEVEVTLSMTGQHNVANALAAWSVARHDGLPSGQVAAALGRFRGVKRRTEVVGTGAGVTVVDDFAHHPTAVGATLQALRKGHPGRRLIAVFEPRSLTAGRRLFAAGYRRAFHPADRVFLAPIYHAQRLSGEDRLDLDTLARRLSDDGVPTTPCESLEELFATLIEDLRSGDVVVVMSSGEFGRLPQRLLEALTATPDRRRKGA